MNKTEYKRLGDYIREVDVRNRDLAVTRLLGVSISKEFIPSIANTIGTDMSSYKIVTRGQFAYGPVTSRNGDKVSIALFADDVPAIISQAYTVFEISDKNRLLPEYLMMWFRRPEFDRYARYHSHGSAREVFDWDEMCDVRLPIPPLSRQREIVAEYETLTRRIRLNERFIASLESLAQTLYRRTFVDDIDPAHLPPGWRTGTLGEIAEINPSLSIKKGKVASSVEMDALPTSGFRIKDFFRKEFSGGSKFQNGDVLFARITPCMENGKAAIVSGLKEEEIAFGSTEFIVLRGRNFALPSFLATLIRSEDFRAYAKSHMKGTDGRQRVDSSALKVYKVVIPSDEDLKILERKLSVFVGHSLTCMGENQTLNKIQNLLLTRMRG